LGLSEKKRLPMKKRMAIPSLINEKKTDLGRQFTEGKMAL
jgi:hypothetical protein